ncbi:MAG TPA: tetratricopeptide repeat protein [Candidatus Xenobia bacterium]|nr:tetratricopeptide repeat protein [Candidatus Xenobia bacterium]
MLEYAFLAATGALPMGKVYLTLLVVLAVSGVYSYAWPTPTLDRLFVTLLHLVAGVAFAVAGGMEFRRGLRTASLERLIGRGLLLAGAATGLVLLITGALRAYRPVLWLHIALTAAGLVILLAAWLRPKLRVAAAAYPAVIVLLAVLCAGLWSVRELRWRSQYRIQNPPLAPASMDEEGDGPRGPFFPSSAQTAHGGLIAGEYFMGSDSCQRCHADIYQQWQSSAHRFASFNNQWYRKSIEYMQEVVGPRPSKWCGGCHDPAVLFSGMMDTPIKENLHRPETQAGIGCVGCHSIVAVKSTMGQGDYVHEVPPLHELAASKNAAVRWVHDFLVKVDPEPHRRAFLKPFVRAQPAEFCSSCHKVHLDVAVNHYRWFRGFNEYDAWQQSGVSGQGARAFYYPPQPQNCVDCHMPLAPSNDLGNHGGAVHSHRFPAANTALPVANQDAVQLKTTESFLKDDIVSVEIFALESESGSLQAPLHRGAPVVRAGESVRLDVVVRTRKLGHLFPGGTNDAFDVWLELLATDETGQPIFWSGRVEDDGKGPVEKNAHFYQTLLVDARSNPINKRNAWAGRSLVYQRLIPPGAADTVRYRLRVPKNAGKEIQLRARLCYRKFSWWNTQFSFAGVRDPSEPNPAVSPHYDDGRWVFTGDTSGVSGKLKHTPELPIVTVAEDSVTVRVVPMREKLAAAQIAAEPADWESWNDYGIGLLAQADWGRAEAAFRRAAELQPSRPDLWTNIGRVHLETGDFPTAREVLEKALQLKPDFGPANYFYARVLQSEGRLEEALQHLRSVAARFPRDRVVRNDLGRILFRLRRLPEAIQEFQQTLTIDPEDLDAHYNLMLCYTALEQPELANQHEVRYLRFKTEELAPSLMNPYLRQHPEANTERQPIHEHESVPLRPARRPPAAQYSRAPAAKATDASGSRDD